MIVKLANLKYLSSSLYVPSMYLNYIYIIHIVQYVDVQMLNKSLILLMSYSIVTI